MMQQQMDMNKCQIQNHIIDNKCFNSEKKIDKGYIRVFFRIRISNSEDQVLGLQVWPDDKVSDIIQRYRWKSGDRDLKKFIYMGKELNPIITVAESCIIDNANILVSELRGVKESCGWLIKKINVRFIKVSDELLNKYLNFETFVY